MDRDQLVTDNVNIAYKLAHKYTPIATWGLDTNEETCSDALLGLVKAARTYDPAKGVPFNSWAGLVIRRYIIDAYRARIGCRNPADRKYVYSLDAMLAEADEEGMPRKLARAIAAPDRTDAIACSTLSDPVDEAIEQLGLVERDLDMLYMPCTAASEKYGLTQQGALYRKSRLVAQLREVLAA